MNHIYWKEKLGIPKEAEVLFYQSPEFYFSNSFKWERDDESSEKIGKIIIKRCIITGVCNRHHKNNGKRQKICLVIEKSKIFS
jgi:hypothetical protein